MSAGCGDGRRALRALLHEVCRASVRGLVRERAEHTGPTWHQHPALHPALCTARSTLHSAPHSARSTQHMFLETRGPRVPRASRATAPADGLGGRQSGHRKDTSSTWPTHDGFVTLLCRLAVRLGKLMPTVRRQAASREWWGGSGTLNAESYSVRNLLPVDEGGVPGAGRCRLSTRLESSGGVAEGVSSGFGKRVLEGCHCDGPSPYRSSWCRPSCSHRHSRGGDSSDRSFMKGSQP